jgi:hypothetical protein
VAAELQRKPASLNVSHYLRAICYRRASTNRQTQFAARSARMAPGNLSHGIMRPYRHLDAFLLFHQLRDTTLRINEFNSVAGRLNIGELGVLMDLL